jgi:hypothetical protein
MSDEKPNPPEKPSAKTSSVPLKKETVRITLRKDAAGSAPPPPAPGAPPAPKPPVAPTPPLGAKTVPLTPAPPAAAPAAGALSAQPTAKLTPAGAPTQPGGTQPLPKATVKLQPAQSPGSAGAVAPITTGKLSGELDDDSAEAGITPFASICLVIALAALAIGVMTSQNVFEQDKRNKEPSYAVPFRDYKHGGYEKLERATGEINWNFNFDENILPEIKEYASWNKSQP